MASLAYFRGEESLSTIKSVIERVATPLKPSLGRLTPEELCIFFHVYSVYAVGWRFINDMFMTEAVFT